MGFKPAKVYVLSMGLWLNFMVLTSERSAAQAPASPSVPSPSLLATPHGTPNVRTEAAAEKLNRLLQADSHGAGAFVADLSRARVEAVQTSEAFMLHDWRYAPGGSRTSVRSDGQQTLFVQSFPFPDSLEAASVFLAAATRIKATLKATAVSYWSPAPEETLPRRAAFLIDYVERNRVRLEGALRRRRASAIDFTEGSVESGFASCWTGSAKEPMGLEPCLALGLEGMTNEEAERSFNALLELEADAPQATARPALRPAMPTPPVAAPASPTGRPAAPATGPARPRQ